MRKQSGIYVHIPFCERKCAYCNFNTTDFIESVVEPYVNAVAREIAYWGATLAERLAAAKSDDSNGASDRPTVDTIYFGGGTPSIIEARHLAALIESCRASFDVAASAEITIEINPATLSPRKIEAWLDGGINRASIGVQSFIDRELASLSRTHSADDARRTFDSLREAGFENISLDLIAGLPDQSLADWEFNLKEALRLKPEHLSLYLLEVKEGTQLFAEIKRGKRPQPDDDLAAQMYRMIRDATLAAGYEHYEISNFALLRRAAPASQAGANSFRSEHNMKYWTAAPFYGMGCGAHSYDAKSRRVNIFKTESYIASVASNGHAIAEQRELTKEDRGVEALFMGLRLTEGISLDEFRFDYGLDVIARYGDELARLTEAELIEIAGNCLKLTEKGFLLSNEVFVAFV